MMKIKKIVLAVICLLPSALACVVLRGFGFSIGANVKIGFSFVFVESLSLSNDTAIGHGNIFMCDSITLKQNSYIGRLNILHGHFSVILCKYAAIGNNNKITRGSAIKDRAFIRLGVLSKITADHRIDVTRSVFFGNYTTLAGTRSEIWTHGYVHASTGRGRYRIDGSVVLGNNVYIGSRSLITSGVRISSSIQVGAGAIVSKSLIEKGVYVSQRLRILPIPGDPNLRPDLLKDPNCGEIVFTKLL